MEHNLQTFNELQTFLALDITVKSEIMKYYTIRDSEGWLSTILHKTKEEAREKISRLKNDTSWENTTSFDILCIDTRVQRIDVIETIIK